MNAQMIHDTAPFGALIRFSDGSKEPPARHHRKRTSDPERPDATWSLAPEMETQLFNLAKFTAVDDVAPVSGPGIGCAIALTLAGGDV